MGAESRVFFLLAILAAPIAAADDLHMANAVLDVTVDTDNGCLTVKSKRLNQAGIVNAKFCRKTKSAKARSVFDSIWGPGSEIHVAHEDGSHCWLRLFAQRPFLHIQTSLHNGDEEPLVLQSLDVLDMEVRLGDQTLASYGTGGLRETSQKIGSYCFHVLVNGHTRNGLVTASLTHERGVGVFFPSPGSSGPDAPTSRLKARIDFGRFQVNTGQTRDTDTLLIGFFNDARLGLEEYANAVATRQGIQLKARPNVYCTWYHAGASSEDEIARNTEFASEHLKPFGLNVIQIDDKWQAILPKGFQHQGKIQTTGPIKVFVDAQGNYPHGMPYTAEMIASHGMTPGIWFMPFAGNFRNPHFDPQIFAKNPDGTPFHDSRWSGTCLDMTQPHAQEFLHERVKRIYDWGFRYFKIDGMHTGMPSKNLYVHTAYRDQEFGLLHDPQATPISAYRKGLTLLRDTAPEAFVLGCNVSQNMMCMGPAFGLIDGMRIGPDNGGAGGGKWADVTRGAWHATNLYFLNGRIWHNDPDPVYVRPSNPLSSARWMCSHLAVSGGMHTSSEQYGHLPAERLGLLRRCLPGHELPARPVDLFETDRPRIWLVQNDRLIVLGLFNWKQNEAEEILYDVGKLGLDSSLSYAAFDYWENKFVNSMQGMLRQTLPGGACRVLALRPSAEHPQLLSTSRHITQGLIDVIDERWDTATKTLTGTSNVIGNDPYELRIAFPAQGAWNPIGATADGAEIQLGKQTESGVRLQIDTAHSQTVTWTIQFRN